MEYDAVISKVSESMGLSRTLVDRAYRAYWRAIREHIISLPLKEDLSDKEFLKLQPNINIPSIGKLYVTLDRYHGMKKYYKNYKDNYYKKDNNVAHQED